MSGNIFQEVKDGLQSRLPDVIQELLPGGRVVGKEYLCASLQGGNGDSCRTNLENGKGSDFASGDAWGDIIGFAAKVWNMRQGEAAGELKKQYHIGAPQVFRPQATSSATQPALATFTPVLPIPKSAPEPPRHHQQHGQNTLSWCYEDEQGRPLAYTVRFDLPDGKAVLPLCYGKFGSNPPQWAWKALPEPRPLYGLPKLAAMPDAPVLLVEGEKAADAAQACFPHHAALTWSGGYNAVGKADFSPLLGRSVIIWPDNDEPAFAAALELARILEGTAQGITIVQPPDTLPDGWDLADLIEPGFLPQVHIETAMPVAEFIRKTAKCFPALAPSISVQSDAATPELEDITIKEWPVFSFDACPGILGDFVRLATRDSEADPAAVAITAMVRFCAEVYGHAPDNGSGQGPHLYIGETVHPPRLFAVICGNSSKARKGTSRHPVTKVSGREYCSLADLREWGLPLPARESGGPLSTGEGLAYHVRDESDEERERRQRQSSNEPIREKGDKRLIVQDEEFASGLTCIKREGNTLSMGIRCFWDTGNYAPLTKNNPITVRGAHINIITHITMQELAVCLGNVQAVNGFGNRFLWICARRSKLVAMPPRMPERELAPIQRELWRLVAHAQKRGMMTTNALEMWDGVYPEISREHTGLAGSIINRGEAQTLRLALAYTLLDGQAHIDVPHLNAALAMWGYAQDSALYIFGDRAADPLEARVLALLEQGPLSATDLSRAFSGHVSKDRLQPILQQLEAQRRIFITKQKNGGRPKLILALHGVSEESAISKKANLAEKGRRHVEGYFAFSAFFSFRGATPNSLVARKHARRI